MTQASLGRSVTVKGELTGSEDLTVEGRVDGTIDLAQHALTIGPNAIINARIVARTVTVFGSVVGNITAHETTIRKGASVEGDLSCTRLAIQDGAHFCGKVDMAAREKVKRGQDAESETPVLAQAV